MSKVHIPSVSDFASLKRILRYTKRILEMGIFFTKHIDCTLTAYFHSDWAVTDEIKSTAKIVSYLLWIIKQLKTLEN